MRQVRRAGWVWAASCAPSVKSYAGRVYVRRHGAYVLLSHSLLLGGSSVPSPPRSATRRGIGKYGRAGVSQGRGVVGGAGAELPRGVVVAVVVPLLLFVVEFATCAACCPGPMDGKVLAAVRQEAGQSLGGLRGLTQSKCAA